MDIHNIGYYAFFENVTEPTKKTAKFEKKVSVGYYPVMDELMNREGKVWLYLQESLKNGDDKPSYWLQARNSLNFTGLKEYFINGRYCGYAFGYPYSKETYGKDNKPNPFFKNRKDGFLFKFNIREDGEVGSFELVVMSGAKSLIGSYCKMLVDGGFDEELEELRRLAV